MCRERVPSILYKSLHIIHAQSNSGVLLVVLCIFLPALDNWPNVDNAVTYSDISSLANQGPIIAFSEPSPNRLGTLCLYFQNGNRPLKEAQGFLACMALEMAMLVTTTLTKTETSQQLVVK